MAYFWLCSVQQAIVVSVATPVRLMAQRADVRVAKQKDETVGQRGEERRVMNTGC